jgi:quinone-modifying oxidoreductase subunit QmoC
MMPAALQHSSWFGHYFPLLAIDTLFIATVTIMGLLMLTSLSKFWKDMVAKMPGRPKESFVSAALITIKEIITHSRFDECDKASPRKTPHLLTFWGMIALFVTTAFVFIGLYFGGPLFNHELHIPMAIGNPIKLLGIAGAVAFCAGLLLLLNNRLNDPEGTGSTTYQDTLFIWTLLIVGLSGVGSYVLRLACPDPEVADAPANLASAVPTMAVAVYFVHLVSVWFLLAYLPYSKFAHMVYRTFALIRAHQVDRWRPATTSESLPKKPEPKPEKKETAEEKDEEKDDDKGEEDEDKDEDKEEAAAAS